MDAVVLLTGDFYTVFNVVLERKDEILKDGSYNALIYSGTVCASQNSQLAYSFFTKAIEKAREEDDINHVITAYHRLIVTKLKRFKDYEDAQKLLNELVSKEIPQSKDYDLYMALYDNMLGLAIVMEQSPFSWISAKTMLINATTRIDKYISVCKDKNKLSQAERYRGQVALNLVQLEIEKHNYIEANKLAVSNLKHVKKYSQGYVAEAYSVLAYTQFMLEQYEDAILTSKLANDAHVIIGNYDGVKTARKLLINCYMRLDQKDKAKDEAQLILDRSFKQETIES